MNILEWTIKEIWGFKASLIVDFFYLLKYINIVACTFSMSTIKAILKTRNSLIDSSIKYNAKIDLIYYKRNPQIKC